VRNWYFYHFDYSRYLEIRPYLGRAYSVTSFDPLLIDVESQTIVEELIEGTISYTTARHALVQHFCCLGEPLTFEKELPRFVNTLMYKPEGDEACTLLSELLAGGLNLDKWLLPSEKIVGFLKPVQAERLEESLLYYRRKNRKRTKNGILTPVFDLVIHILDIPPQPKTVMDRLLPFLQEAISEGLGIAVVIA
jgi:hypothetical protein